MGTFNGKDKIYCPYGTDIYSGLYSVTYDDSPKCVKIQKQNVRHPKGQAPPRRELDEIFSDCGWNLGEASQERVDNKRITRMKKSAFEFYWTRFREECLANLAEENAEADRAYVSQLEPVDLPPPKEVSVIRKMLRPNPAFGRGPCGGCRKIVLLEDLRTEIGGIYY